MTEWSLYIVARQISDTCRLKKFTFLLSIINVNQLANDMPNPN